MTILLVLLSIAILVLLIVWAKLNPFLAFLISSITAGFLLGLPANQIAGSVQRGMGVLLGDLVMKIFGQKHITWAMAITGLVVGIPLFYNVGFVLLVPLAFTVAYQYKISAVYVGIPLLAALSVTHGFLPPHPSPAALVAQFDANMGLTLFYGFMIAIPTIALAGPLFARTLKNMKAEPLKTFQAETKPESELPSASNSFFTALLPVFLLVGTTALNLNISPESSLAPIIAFVADPGIVMLVSVLIATYTLGLNRGFNMKQIMDLYTVATKDIAMILLIVAGAGALKQIFTDTGVSLVIAEGLQTWDIHPLILAWIITAIIRVCVGSATVAGLTTAGIIAPLVTTMNVDPNLLVLSIGAGSLMFSHFNDAGFWMYKEFFNVSIKDTIKSWSLMETIVAVAGLAGVLILDIFV